MTGRGSASIRVLIVDDMVQVRESLRTVLALAAGIEIVGEAGNGQEAVSLAEALRPQVVVMDLEMPVTGGYEAARRIKALYPACRMVALTIHGGEAERQRALAAGIDVFIVKGAPLAVLLKAIGAATAVGGAPAGDSA